MKSSNSDLRTTPATLDVRLPTPAPEGGWMRRLYPFVRPHLRKIGIALAASIGSQGITATIPIIVEDSIDRIFEGDGVVGPLLVVMLILGTVQAILSATRRLWGGRVGFDIEFGLRTAIYNHLQRLDFARHDTLQTGQLVSRSNADVGLLQRILMFTPFLVGAAVMFFTGVAFMLFRSPLLTLVVLSVTPGAVILSTRMRKTLYPASWDALNREGEIAQVVEDAVTGVRVVKGFGQEEKELARLTETASGLFGSRMRNVRLTSKFQPAIGALPRVGQLAVLLFGGYLVIQGDIKLGTYVAFNTYLLMMIFPVQMLSFFLPMAQAARASGERVLELLDSTPEVVEAENPLNVASIAPEVVFDNVSFGYLRSQPVLDGFSVRIAPGERVAFVGASGSGKSTITLLVPRFYDTQQGAVRVDGTDVRDLGLDSLRSHIGMVFEESFLFSESVRANIAYGRPNATDEEVTQAATAAGAHEFISRLVDGYDTVVGERGLTLSGGQRQRVALARALMTNPQILILDDATSSVDAAVEREIHETLETLLPGRTTLIVAHRRSTIDLADRIVVVDKGRVVDTGTHWELLERCSLYRQLLEGDDEYIDGPATPTQGVTASAWRIGDQNGDASVSTGAVNQAANKPSGIRKGGGRGPVGGGDGHFGFMPPGEELQDLLDKLPPIIDEPDIDLQDSQRHEPNFTLKRFLAPYRVQLFLGFLLAAGASLAGLLGPKLVERAINRGIVPRDFSEVLIAGAGFLVLVAVTWLLGFVLTRYTGRTAERLLLSLRIRVFAQLQRLSMAYYEREMAGRIMTRMTSDIDALAGFVQSGLINAFVQVLTFAGVIAILIEMNLTLAAVSLAVSPILIAASIVFKKHSATAYTKVREELAGVNANLQESVSGLRVAQAFTREERNMEGFRDKADSYLQARVKGQRLQAVYFPIIELLAIVSQVLVIWVGASLVKQGLTPGELVAFLLYVTTVFGPLQQLSQLFDTYQQARAAFAKVRELLATETLTPQIASPINPGRPTGAIEFSDLSFKYPQGSFDALKGVNLKIEPNETVALVGATGAGKSTIVKLIARFYDSTGGKVLIDGTDIKDLDLAAYRHNLGYVPQEAFLFSGTIRDNIAYGNDKATDEQVETAARAVGAHDFIATLTDGYHEEVMERGKSMSAGQRQLIALARAHLVDPAILLLDEATSNLDLATETRVARAMGVASQGRTTIVIAHRLTTARRADRIVVVDDGRVVETGHHDELIARGGKYTELWEAYGAERATA